MNTKQFSELAKSEAMHFVNLVCVRMGEYEIWAYGGNGTEAEVNRYGNQLHSAKNEPRKYTSLDRAYAAIRDMGFTLPITIYG